MADDISLSEQFEDVERRFGSWDAYKTSYFVRLDPQARATELSIYDRAMEPKTSKEFAEHWTRFRDLQQIDSLMRRAGK